MFSFAIAGVVQGVYKMNDAVVNSVCLVDDTYLRFDAFLNNVKVPLKLLNENFGEAVDQLKDAAVQDPQLTINIRDIGSAFDMVKEQAINNKAQVAPGTAFKTTCDLAWDEMITQCESAKTTIGDSADEVEQTCVDFFLLFFVLLISLSLSLTHFFFFSSFFFPLFLLSYLSYLLYFTFILLVVATGLLIFRKAFKPLSLRPQQKQLSLWQTV